MKKIFLILLFPIALFGQTPPQFGNAIGAANTTATVVLQNAVAATGNGTSLTVTGYGSAVLAVSGTFVATINFEASVDAGATWISILATNLGASNIVTSTTTTGTFRLNTTGMDLVRARVTWTSGTSVTVRGWATNSTISNKVVTLASGTNPIGSLIANQSVNVAQINGVTPLMGAGANGTGAQRIALATDQTQVSTAGVFSVRVDQTTVGTTNAFSLAQLGATAVATNNGTASAGTLRVTLASDNTSNTNPFLQSHAIPEQVIDVASAAITSTTTTAAFTPTRGQSYFLEVPITVVTGTSPTYDLSIEESADGGTNWFKVWDFERMISTTGSPLRSPLLPDRGNRVRYVQTLSGTTPSFTRAINRLQSNTPTTPKARLIDRTITLTTLNSTSPVLTTGGASIVQLVINVGAITTTAPAISIEGSEDNFVTFYTLPVSALTAVASSTVQTTLVGVSAPFIRAKVTTAGVGVTAGYIALKAF